MSQPEKWSSPELLRRFRDEEPEAAVEVFRRHGPEIEQLVRKIVPKYVRRAAGGTADVAGSVGCDLIAAPAQPEKDTKGARKFKQGVDDPIWRLLIEVVFRHYEKHRKRIQREAPTTQMPPHGVGDADEDVDWLLDIESQLDPVARRVFREYYLPKALKAPGRFTLQEMAELLNRAVHVVRRMTEQIEEVVREYYLKSLD